MSNPDVISCTEKSVGHFFAVCPDGGAVPGVVGGSGARLCELRLMVGIVPVATNPQLEGLPLLPLALGAGLFSLDGAHCCCCCCCGGGGGGGGGGCTSFEIWVARILLC